MNRVDKIARVSFAKGLADGKIQCVQSKMDEAYQSAVLKLSRIDQTDRSLHDLKILYSPLHGVGRTSVEPVLLKAGFKNLEVFGPQSEPNGDFPNVPNHVANPENSAVVDSLIEEAKRSGFDLVLASDPDADRIGRSLSGEVR